MTGKTFVRQNAVQNKKQVRFGFWGFTLAEVLITLVVIGVIASITVPTIMANHQKESVLAKLKKTYSTLGQVVKLSQVDNGPCDEWGVIYDDGERILHSTLIFETYIKPYVRTIKECSSAYECGYPLGHKWKYMNGQDYNLSMQSSPSSRAYFYLSDGVFVMVNTGSSEASGGGNTIAYYSMPTIIVDINGTQNPNKIGRDTFFMKLHKDKGVVPYGDDSDLDNCNITGYGLTCLNKIMKNSWKISSDYPW